VDRTKRQDNDGKNHNYLEEGRENKNKKSLGVGNPISRLIEELGTKKKKVEWGGGHSIKKKKKN